MPSSFKGGHGKIVYKLEAKISRSWRMDRTVERELNFVSREGVPNLGLLMCPQHSAKQKGPGVFSSGQVNIDVKLERLAYAPVVGETIPSRTQRTVNSALKIPPDQCLSIQNCDIISVEYELKVYLDISFALDPSVKFMLFIVPESCISGLLHSGAPSHSDFPASIPSGTYPPIAKPYKLPATVVNPAYPNNYPALPESTGFSIRNKLLGTCLQVQHWQEGHPRGGKVVLGECNPGSALQEWRWLPESQALSNLHTGECLTALRNEKQEDVRLHRCSSGIEAGDVEGGWVGAEFSQAWSCSKKGHLNLQGEGLHLSAGQESSRVFLSKQHGHASKWRTMGNHTLCSRERTGYQQQHSQGRSLEPHKNSQPLPISVDGGAGSNITDVGFASLPQSTKTPEDPTMIYFSMDYGMGWKVTMLVLSSSALLLGTVILILNVYFNRRKKVVCVLKSYAPKGELSQPGSPVPNDRAPLTKHAMRQPYSSPSLQRGEILIEWKDGTFTPLYESYLTD
ncbi:uncharacterized protein FYW47_007166 [Aplochiton taeniatus]